MKFLHQFEKAKKYTGQQVQYMQQKLDGHRVTACSQPLGYTHPIILYTRSQTDLFPDLFQKAQSKKIWTWIANLMDVPPYSSIDGELIVPGKPASYIKTAIKECDPNLKFVAFAFPWLHKQRRYTDPLEWAMHQAAQFKIPFIPFIKLDEPTEIDPEYWIRKANPNTEGWVAKRYHYQGWYKLKRIKTIDLVVTGFKEGKGKYTGKLGALQCSGYDGKGQLREVCLCSGMTDDERDKFSPNDIGRTCEIQYQEVASLGRLRHPIFKRWRDDEKKPFECTLAQEPELLVYWDQRGD